MCEQEQALLIQVITQLFDGPDQDLYLPHAGFSQQGRRRGWRGVDGLRGHGIGSVAMVAAVQRPNLVILVRRSGLRRAE
jgi:hypothetical protein